MRMGSAWGLALVGAVSVLASCSQQQPTVPDWACGSAEVPYGARVECSTSALVFPVDAGTYGCNNGGDYNPNCPPPGAGSDGGTTDYSPDGSTGTGDDGGTTDFGPDGSASGSSSGVCGSSGSSGGSTSSSGAAGSSSGSCVGPQCNPGHGGGPPGHGSSSGSGSSGSGSSSGGYSSGSSGGSGSSGSSGGGSGGESSSGGGDDGGSNGPPWTCVPDPPEVTCSQPPVCDHGAHAAPCGACVPDDTTGDCTPPSEGGCWVTGGGFIVESSSKDTFGGNGMPMRDGSVRGEWENVDHATGDNLHGTVNYLFCRVVPGPGPGHPNGPQHDFVDNQVYFGGPGRYFVNAAWADGYWFDVVAEDHGEPGRQDTYQITIRTYANGQAGSVVYEASGSLAGGNIQLHPPNPGHPASQSTLPTWVQLQP
jgi:hypothetical protein